MKPSLLLELLATFNATDRRLLLKWLHSPFVNKRPQYAALLEYLLDNRSPETEKAFQIIFPDTPYDDQKMRLANSELLEMIEDFLVYRQQFKSNAAKAPLLAAAYRQRQLPRHFKRALHDAELLDRKDSRRDATWYEQHFALEYEAYKLHAGTRRTEPFNLQHLIDLQDTAFIINKLQLACLSVSHQAVYKTDYNFGLLGAVIQQVEQENLLQIPAVALYYYCYRFLSDSAAEESFRRFQEQLTLHAACFEQEELSVLHLLAINFGIKKINENHQAYLRETLNLYRSALERDFLLENGILSRFAFNNIAAIALKLGEAAWTEQFIHRYAPLLEKKYQAMAASFNLARVAYFQKDYRAALLFLQQADYKDLIHNLNAKVLQLKIYFETDELDLLQSHLASMKTFISRQHAIGYHKANYLNIVRYTQAITALRPGDRPAREQLRRQVETEPNLTEKDWLLETLARR